MSRFRKAKEQAITLIENILLNESDEDKFIAINNANVKVLSRSSPSEIMLI